MTPLAISLMRDIRAKLMELEGILVESPKEDPAQQDISGPVNPEPMTIDDPRHWPLVRNTPLFQRIQAKIGRAIKDRDTWLIYANMIKDYGKDAVEKVLADNPGNWPDFYLRALKGRQSAY